MLSSNIIMNSCSYVYSYLIFAASNKVISTEVDYENVSSNYLLITGFVKKIIQVTCSLMLLKRLIKLSLY